MIKYLFGLLLLGCCACNSMNPNPAELKACAEACGGKMKEFTSTNGCVCDTKSQDQK